jgi:NADH:ubiquinone oxidoreductase subunit 6 (subunit J)
MNYKLAHPVLTQILVLLTAVMVIWLTIRMIRGNPEALHREALSKSFFTIGILALILIAFVGICIWLLRSFS